MGRTGEGTAGQWVRPLGWGGAIALILAPLIAMQFTREVQWTFSDFLIAALLIGGTGLAVEFAVRRSSSFYYRAAALVALGTAFLLIWANAAVGYIGDDDAYNAVFVGVVAVAFLGAVIARFRASGMAVAMVVAGAMHAVAGAIGAPRDPVTIPITIVFTAMWLLSALLFRWAARPPRQ